MINLSRQQLIVLGIVILIVIILLSVGISVADRAPTPTATKTVGTLKWMGDERVVVPRYNGPHTFGAPALGVYDNKLYLVYRGHYGDNNTIWWSWYDGSQWEGDEQVVVPGKGPYTDAAPALAVYDNKLYLVHKGNSVDTIWWSWYVRR
jgi:hypothetical protein